MWELPPPWKRSCSASSPTTARCAPSASGSVAPSFLSSTAQSAASSRARASWASTSKGSAGSATSADSWTQAAYGPVDVGLVELPGAHRLDDLARAAPAAAGHLEVEAGAHRGDRVVDAAPVGDDEAVVAPVVAQDLGEQPGVLAGVHAVDAVVGRHDGRRLGLDDDALERRQVDLAQRPRVDVGADLHPVGLLVVGREVLHRRADALRLQPRDVRGAEDAAEQGVLGDVLEVAAAQRRPLDVDAGAEHHVHAEGARLAADGGADARGDLRVPAAADRDRRREAGGGQRRVQAQVVEAAGLPAHPVRAVGHDDRGQSDLLGGLGGPEVVAGQQSRLLLERQRGEVVRRHGRPSERRQDPARYGAAQPVPRRPAAGRPRRRGDVWGAAPLPDVLLLQARRAEPVEPDRLATRAPDPHASRLPTWSGVGQETDPGTCSGPASGGRGRSSA